MNYKNAAISEIKEIASRFPDYTLGQIIYALTNRKPDNDQTLKEWLYTISDEDLYTFLEETKYIEQE